MSTPSPDHTPANRAPGVRAVQWLHAFACTPDSPHVRGAKSRRSKIRTGAGAVDAEDSREEDNTLPTFSSTVQGSARKRRSRTRCTYATGANEHAQDRDDDGNLSTSLPPLPPVDTPLCSRRSSRVVLDAVEIIAKHRPRCCMPSHLATERAREEASSHYPSPPTSRANRDSSQILHPASPEVGLPSKTSKYFATRTEQFPILTPPCSPVLTIPVCIESSDFEYPPLDDPLDEAVEGAVEGAVDGSSTAWYGNPGLFDDLMIMLRRLKPILVQESVRDDPWKVLIAVRLLNVTAGKAAIPVFCKIISRWPTPQDLVHAPQDELVELLRPLGLYNKRASWLRDVSRRYIEPDASMACLLSDKHMIPHVPGVGPYALDSLRIFCSKDETWKRVMPQDKELVRYLRWRWAAEEGKVWYPEMGAIGDVDVPYLITLVDDLAVHYDDAIGGEGYLYHFYNDLSLVWQRGHSIFRVRDDLR